jgi:hypothetical protein
MIISVSDTQQDTQKVGKFVINESVRLKTFALPEVRRDSSKDSVKHVFIPVPKPVEVTLTDTTAVCSRNSIADITFYDSTNFISTLKSGVVDRFLYSISETNRTKQAEEKAVLVKHLKPGQENPPRVFNNDWIILIILVASFLFSLIRTGSKNILLGVSRFFLFRGINDPSSRDIGGLFHWQSTILNLVTFIIFGLYIYCSAVSNDFIPSSVPGIIFWLISLGVIIAAVTLRHIVCVITGNLSEQREVFREYLLGVYQSYRFTALVLFILVVLMLYTMFFPARLYLISGLIVFGFMYLFRVLRLFIIFINRNISIFYLILYLCALEILPVVISVKYITGLV